MRNPKLYINEAVLVRSGIHWKNYIIPTFNLVIMTMLLYLRIKTYGQPLLLVLQDKIATGYWRMISFAECLALFWIILSIQVKIIKLGKIGYYITDKRIIMISGWLTIKTSEMMLDRCETVNLKQNLYERLYGTGDLLILSAGASILFDDIPRAEQFKDTIQQILMDRETEHGTTRQDTGNGWNFGDFRPNESNLQ